MIPAQLRPYVLMDGRAGAAPALPVHSAVEAPLSGGCVVVPSPVKVAPVLGAGTLEV